MRRKESSLYQDGTLDDSMTFNVEIVLLHP